MASVIRSAREGIDAEILFFQSDTESIHFLEKLSQEFKKKCTEITIKSLSGNAKLQEFFRITSHYFPRWKALFISAIQEIFRGNFRITYLD